LAPSPVLLLARLYGSWLHQIFSLTQHAELAEKVRDHGLNRHTVEMNVVFRFLYFRENYHIQHHMFPMVPFMLCPGSTAGAHAFVRL
jgi:fatty acid desaturase